MIWTGPANCIACPPRAVKPPSLSDVALEDGRSTFFRELDKAGNRPAQITQMSHVLGRA